MTDHRIPSLRRDIARCRARRGFSLMEILIVIALIAMLAGTVIVGMDKLFGGGQKQIAETFVKTTGPTALWGYRIAVGKFPTTDQGLAALRSKPSNAGGNWAGPYLTEDPMDPWENPYQYRSPGVHNPDSYDLWSLGPDGKEGTDDIGNWESK